MFHFNITAKLGPTRHRIHWEQGALSPRLRRFEHESVLLVASLGICGAYNPLHKVVRNWAVRASGVTNIIHRICVHLMTTLM